MLGKSVVSKLKRFLKDKNATKTTKIKIAETLVFSKATYGCEIWTMRTTDRKKKLDAFELFVWRKILRVSWTERKTKQRNFAEMETKHYIRSYDKNAENGIFRTRDEDTSILGERYSAGNNCRSREKRGKNFAL